MTYNKRLQPTLGNPRAAEASSLAMQAYSVIVVLSALLSACAQKDPRDAIIEIAKQDSAKYCSGRAKEGCEYSIVKTPDGWGVIARPIVRDANGERSYTPGLWQSYSYDGDGKLLRDMPGL
jgi:hypothetical protein